MKESQKSLLMFLVAVSTSVTTINLFMLLLLSVQKYAVFGIIALLLFLLSVFLHIYGAGKKQPVYYIFSVFVNSALFGCLIGFFYGFTGNLITVNDMVLPLLFALASVMIPSVILFFCRHDRQRVRTLRYTVLMAALLGVAALFDALLGRRPASYYLMALLLHVFLYFCTLLHMIRRRERDILYVVSAASFGIFYAVPLLIKKLIPEKETRAQAPADGGDVSIDADA